jgi:uncharacterized protein YkwD
MNQPKQPSDDYTKKAKEVFKLLNEYRKTPKILIKHLEMLKKYIDNKNILSEPGKIQVQMVEGKEAVNEAIKYLQEIITLPPLIWDENLALSALEHVMDIGPKGLVSYQSSDGTEPEDRITKYGNYVESLGENIDFGPNDAMGVIVSLLLDDGDPERPHRDNLFKSDYKKVGIACGTHKTEYQMCVMDFAFDFLPFNPDKEEEESLSKNKISTPSQVNNNNNNGNFPHNNNSNNSNSNNTSTQQVDQNRFSNLSTNTLTKQQQPNINSQFPQPSTNKQFTNNQYEEVSKQKTEKKETKPFVDQPKTNQKAIEQNVEFDNRGKSDNNIMNNINISNKINNSNQSPLVKLSLERDDYTQLKENKFNDEIFNSVKLLNAEKKVVAKLIEITQKITYIYEDGSKREVVDTQNHKFDL